MVLGELELGIWVDLAEHINQARSEEIVCERVRERMLENPTAPIPSVSAPVVKRYAPPNQRYLHLESVCLRVY